MKNLINYFKLMNRTSLINSIKKISESRFTKILQRTFVSFSGLILVSSLFVLIKNLPIEGIISGLALDGIRKISEIGFSYTSIFVIIAFTYYYLQDYNSHSPKNVNEIQLILINISIFLMINLQFEYMIERYTIDVISMEYLGAKGIFSSLLISFISMRIYLYFFERKLYIKLPKEVPNVISDSFVSIIPSFVLFSFWWVIIYLLKFDVLSLINLIFNPLLKMGNSLILILIIPLLNRLLWFVGIHGGSVINSIFLPLFTIMNSSNLEAFLNSETIPYIASGIFYSSYVWIGSFPVALALMFSNKKEYKAIGYASLIPALFNIDESIIFGLPVILNPIMFIPFILSGIVPSVLSYIAISVGVISAPVLSVPWTIPAPFKALLSTNNDFRAVIWVFLLWGIIFLIYYPFIKKISSKN